jgi:hypothetical protein
LDESTKTAHLNIETSSVPNLVGAPNQRRIVTSITDEELKITNPRTPAGVTLELVFKRAKWQLIFRAEHKARLRLLLARTRSQQAGRACPLCPGTSDVNLFRYRERVIDLNAQISDGALDLCVAEQELDGPKIAVAPIDQRRLRSSERMSR